MTTYIALLYSIILDGGRRVVMTDLKAMAEELGFGNVRTLVATGNLLFEARKTDLARLESRLEAAFRQKFGKHIDIIARDAETWRKLVAANPFPEESGTDADKVAVRVMREPVGADVVAKLQGYLTGDERLVAVDGDLWAWLPYGAPKSRLPGAVTPKRAGVGTWRNWNTARRLGEML